MVLYETVLPYAGETAQELHGIVASNFPEQRPLFAVDGRKVYIRSTAPGLEYSAKIIDLTAMKAGDTYTFEVILNPSKRELKTGKRVALADHEHIRSYVDRKFAAIGGSILDYSIEILGNVPIASLYNATHVPARAFTLHAVKVSGVLSVTDRDQFLNTLATGVSTHGKAYGFGLLRFFR